MSDKKVLFKNPYYVVLYITASILVIKKILLNKIIEKHKTVGSYDPIIEPFTSTTALYITAVHTIINFILMIIIFNAYRKRKTFPKIIASCLLVSITSQLILLIYLLNFVGS